MKIEILKDGLHNKQTGKKLSKGDQIEVSKERGQAAIDSKKAKELKPKKSHQKKVEDSLEKK